MPQLFSSLSENFEKLFTSIGWNDILDIIIIAVSIFYLFKLFGNTRAMHLIRGLVFVSVVYFIVTILNLPTTSFLLDKLFANIVIVVVVLFQPEIRHTIEEFGRGRVNFGRFKLGKTSIKKQITADISSIVNACINMSNGKVGALIIFEGKTPLTEIIATGSRVDASITAPVIENIFFPKAPLHDGAMIIKDGRINSAGCILPLTERKVDIELGTRHRAAIGLSESCDALCVVVSEESGAISIAKGGNIERDISSAQLLDRLTEFLLPAEKQEAE